MAIVDLVMPKLGESIMEATILKWHKQPGDQVMPDENIVDIATDKVDTEVPSSVDGILEDVLFQENDVVPVGAPIARIRTSSPDNATIPAADISPSSTFAPPPPSRETVGRTVAITPQPNQSSINSQRFYSPLVLTIAASENISMQELEQLPGTGSDGRVTKKDILQYIEERKHTGAASPHAHSAQPVQGTAQTGLAKIESAISGFAHDLTRQNQATTGMEPFRQGNVEIIEMDRMRKMIARHMVDSVHTSAHVTSFAEADVTNMVFWRDRVKKEFEKRENEKITFTPLFIEAVIRCIKKYPWLNSSIEGDRLIVKKDIHIGMATALPNGNLIVPVIKHADQLNLVGLTRQVNRLAADARNNKLRPDDTADGTFTITNVGSFGSIMGTPIINQPQVAILAVGAIKKKPVVIETAQGDSIAIRHMMYLSLSYDHRIIDGALGSTFLNAVAKELENFDGEREL